MQPVSQAWIDNQKKAVVSKGLLKLDLFVANTDLYNSGTTVSSNGQTIYCNLPNVIKEENVVKPQPFLGLNEFLLDGNVEIDTLAHAGAYAFYSGKIGDGLYPFDYVITLPQATSKKTKSIKIIFDKDGGYATSLSVGFNDADNTTVTISNNNNTEVEINLEGGIIGFTTITVSCSNWSLAYQRRKISNIFLGFTQTFKGKDIIKYEAIANASLVCESVPQNEISFELDNSKNIFDSDPNNTSDINIYPYLSTRQIVVVSYGYTFNNVVEWINGGTFYLSEWNAPQNGITATFTAKNILSFLTQECVVSVGSGTSYTSIIQSILQGAGINKYYIDPIYNYVYTSGSLSLSNMTVAEALQRFTQSVLNRVLWCDRDGTIRLETIPSTIYNDYVIDFNNCYKYPELSLETEIKEVIVNGTSVTSGLSQGDIMKISNDLIQNNSAVGGAYLDIKEKRNNYEAVLRIDPRLELFDIVSLINKNGKKSDVIVTGTTITYNGAFSGKVEAKVW